MIPINLQTPQEVATDVAGRVRQLRLQHEWTQQELAERAGITMASYRRFESSGLISLDRLLRIAEALGTLGEFDSLFRPPPAATLSDLEQLIGRQTRRKRGRRRDAKD